MELTNYELVKRYVHGPSPRLLKDYRIYFGFFIWPESVWNADTLPEQIVRSFNIPEKMVRRGTTGRILSIYFHNNLPTVEQVELACLGAKGMKRIDKLVNGGVI